MGDESRVADYFVVAGLPDRPEPLKDSSDKHFKGCVDPITDITVIFPSEGEKCPEGWIFLDRTPSKGLADLNCGSFNSPEVFICYRRGRDKPPLVDIGVLYEHKERVLEDSKIVSKTPFGRVANVNNTAARTFLTYRRAPANLPANELVVTDICVINETKMENPPHAYCMIKKNLNKGLWGNAVYLCYKKSVHRANLLSYKAAVLSRYPAFDHPDSPLPPAVHMFCMPMGASLEVWSPQTSQPNPLFSTFVLTSEAVEKVYGAAVTFYERYPVEKLTPEQVLALKEGQSSDFLSNGSSVNVNKCICILSHWPFFDCFEKFLKFLYRLSGENYHPVPIERYISHLLEEIPFPSPQRPRILIQLSAEERLILAQPEDLPLPRSGAGFLELLDNLSIEDILLVLLLVITEQKILVHSLRPNVLTAVVEAVSMIVFPFKWQCCYIPLCPLALAEYLQAPVPVLVGVDSRFFDLYEPPSDVTCVDLDTNNITSPEDKRHLTTKMLPKRPTRILRSALEDLCIKSRSRKICQAENGQYDDSLDFQVYKKEQSLQLEIQVAFLRFMASILKGYRMFLLPITKPPTAGVTDTKSLFDIQGFLKTRDKAYHRFYNLVTGTQMFIRFIEERSFVSDMDAGLAFFDECIEKVEIDDAGCKLLEIEDGLKSERTVFIPPPEPTGLPDGVTYSYNGFHLNPTLFKEVGARNRLQVPTDAATPGSPMARRTKHEVKIARKLARYKHKQAGRHWAKHLLTTCYSIWFIHLPSHILMDPDKASVCLKTAYDLLGKLQKLKVRLNDEVCYRVMMQLCGIHGQPGTAVKLLLQMKENGIQPNALTYGYYNRAVLEAKWPQEHSPSRLLWNKLRNVTMAVSYLSKLKEGGSAGTGSGSAGRGSRDKLPAASSDSTTSLDHHGAAPQFAQFDQHCSRVGSIVKPTPKLIRDTFHQQSAESAAGLLITTEKRHSSALELRSYYMRRNSCTEFTTHQQSAPRGADVRLRRGSMSPMQAGSEGLSFANDNFILEKYNNRMKKGKDSALASPKRALAKLQGSDDRDCPGGGDRFRGASLVSRLSDMWRASEDSVASDISGQEDTPQKKKPNGKPPWNSSELLVAADRDARLRHEERAASENLEDSERSVNGSIRSGSEVSDRLPSGTISPVKENDPLGALDDNDRTITNLVDANNLLNKKHILDSVTSTPQKTILDADRKRSRIEDYFNGSLDALFGVASFDRPIKDKTAYDESHKKNIHRSSTLPGAVTDFLPPVPSPSLGMNLNFGSPFKFSFSGTKKNEILEVGLSTVKTVKSAASILAKRLEVAISNNSTPVKSLNQTPEIAWDDGAAAADRSAALDFESWTNLFGDSSRSSRKSSTAVPPVEEPLSEEALKDTLYGGTPSRSHSRSLALSLVLTTCSRCNGCSSLLHDEEVIAGWTSDDSNLNTKCHFCEKPTLPFLTVTIRDYRSRDRNSVNGSQQSLSCGQSMPELNRASDDAFILEPISVPYLNPLVLRKELENILQHKGDPSLMHATFVDQHPIIYWNMVWWFERISVPSHLPGLLLTSQTLNKQQTVHPSWENCTDHNAVSIACLWDNPRLHDEVGQPMYMLWQQKEQQSSLVSALVTDRNAVSKKDLGRIIYHLKTNNIRDPMLFLIKERAKQTKKELVHGRSIYREILYLALVEFGRNLLDLDTFEREYSVEYQKMLTEGVLLQKCDKPPVSASFRNYFAPLLLLQELS